MVESLTHLSVCLSHSLLFDRRYPINHVTIHGPPTSTIRIITRRPGNGRVSLTAAAAAATAEFADVWRWIREVWNRCRRYIYGVSEWAEMMGNHSFTLVMVMSEANATIQLGRNAYPITIHSSIHITLRNYLIVVPYDSVFVSRLTSTATKL